MGPHLGNMEMLGLLAAQRDRRPVDPKLERIAAERAAQKAELGSLDEAEHHEPLDCGVSGVDRLDPHASPGLRSESVRTRLPPQIRMVRDYRLSNGWRRMMTASRAGPVEIMSIGTPASSSMPRQVGLGFGRQLRRTSSRPPSASSNPAWLS